MWIASVGARGPQRHKAKQCDEDDRSRQTATRTKDAKVMHEMHGRGWLLHAVSAAVKGARVDARSSDLTSVMIDSVFDLGHRANSAFVLNLSATSS